MADPTPLLTVLSVIAVFLTMWCSKLQGDIDELKKKLEAIEEKGGKP